jgi:hypothetical protein
LQLDLHAVLSPGDFLKGICFNGTNIFSNCLEWEQVEKISTAFVGFVNKIHCQVFVMLYGRIFFLKRDKT